MADVRRPRPCQQPAHDDAGFTLIEVMAALLVFAGLATAVFSILANSLMTTHENSQRVIAANIAQSWLEHLRLVGTTGITPGLTTTHPTGANADFTVSTTASWVGLGQTTSACASAQPGQAYLRIHVEVIGPRLGAPSTIDTVIEPDAAPSTTGTGAAAISITDQLGAPVRGIVVTGVDSAHPTNSFSYTTGADGCLYVPQLLPTGSLVVSVVDPGSPHFVAPTPTGTSTTVAITADTLARPTLLFAPEARIDFDGALADYPLAQGAAVTWGLNQTGSSAQAARAGTQVAGLWPSTTGFNAWAGDCADADPQAYSALPQSFALIAGGVTAAHLDVRPVKLRGLPAGVHVLAQHAPAGAGCTSTSLDLGVTDKVGVLRVGMPNGTWSFSAGGQTQQTPGPLEPPAPGDTETPTVVSFTLANLDSPSATASPTASPTATTTASPTTSATP